MRKKRNTQLGENDEEQGKREEEEELVVRREQEGVGVGDCWLTTWGAVGTIRDL